MKSLRTKEFIEKARKVHSNKFDYSKVEYINNKTKVIIICPNCCEFEQTPNVHLAGNGCALCTGNKRLTTEQFIKKSKEKHGNIYNYDKTTYTGSRQLVTITCPIHGDFDQTAAVHMKGAKCPKCRKN